MQFPHGFAHLRFTLTQLAIEPALLAKGTKIGQQGSLGRAQHFLDLLHVNSGRQGLLELSQVQLLHSRFFVVCIRVGNRSHRSGDFGQYLAHFAAIGLSGRWQHLIEDPIYLFAICQQLDYLFSREFFCPLGLAQCLQARGQLLHERTPFLAITRANLPVRNLPLAPVPVKRCASEI